jgi:hypothetical protein
MGGDELIDFRLKPDACRACRLSAETHIDGAERVSPLLVARLNDPMTPQSLCSRMSLKLCSMSVVTGSTCCCPSSPAPSRYTTIVRSRSCARAGADKPSRSAASANVPPCNELISRRLGRPAVRKLQLSLQLAEPGARIESLRQATGRWPDCVEHNLTRVVRQVDSCKAQVIRLVRAICRVVRSRRDLARHPMTGLTARSRFLQVKPGAISPARVLSCRSAFARSSTILRCGCTADRLGVRWNRCSALSSLASSMWKWGHSSPRCRSSAAGRMPHQETNEECPIDVPAGAARRTGSAEY